MNGNEQQYRFAVLFRQVPVKRDESDPQYTGLPCGPLSANKAVVNGANYIWPLLRKFYNSPQDYFIFWGVLDVYSV